MRNRELSNDIEEAVSELTYRRIRGDIISGQLAPETKLRLEQLRKRYSTSVSTLREILNRLVAEDLVLAEGQRGFEVAPVSARNLREVAELRLLLELHALIHSFDQGDLDWEARVVAAHHKLSQMEMRLLAGDAADVVTWKRYDWEFHQALISGCGSSVLMSAHGAAFDKYLRYQLIGLSFRGKVQVDEHKLLRDSALNRDAETAVTCLKSHLNLGVADALKAGKLQS